MTRHPHDACLYQRMCGSGHISQRVRQNPGKSALYRCAAPRIRRSDTHTHTQAQTKTVCVCVCVLVCVLVCVRVCVALIPNRRSQRRPYRFHRLGDLSRGCVCHATVRALPPGGWRGQACRPAGELCGAVATRSFQKYPGSHAVRLASAALPSRLYASPRSGPELDENPHVPSKGCKTQTSWPLKETG